MIKDRQEEKQHKADCARKRAKLRNEVKKYRNMICMYGKDAAFVARCQATIRDLEKQIASL